MNHGWFIMVNSDSYLLLDDPQLGLRSSVPSRPFPPCAHGPLRASRATAVGQHLAKNGCNQGDLCGKCMGTCVEIGHVWEMYGTKCVEMGSMWDMYGTCSKFIL